MPRKREVTTITKEIEPEPEPVEIPAEPIEIAEPPTADEQQHEDDLQSFISLAGPANHVRIYKEDLTKGPVYCGRCSPCDASEDLIQSEWGEGRYIVRLLDERNRFVSQRKVSVGPPASKKEPVHAAAPAVPGVDPLISMQIEMLREEARTNRELLIKMIDKMGSNNGAASPLSEFASVFTMLKETLTPKSTTEAVTEIIGVLKQGIELGSSGGAVAKEGGWMGIVKDIASSIPDVMAAVGASMRRAPGPVAGPPPAQVLAAPAAIAAPAENPLLVRIKQAIAWVKPRAAKNHDPAVYVDLIMSNLDDESFTAFVQLLDYSFDDLAKLDPDILTPIYRPWFESLFTQLKDAINERNGSVDTGGETREPSDHADNGAVGEGQPANAGNPPSGD